jgi:hypothetical protein
MFGFLENFQDTQTSCAGLDIASLTQNAKNCGVCTGANYIENTTLENDILDVSYRLEVEKYEILTKALSLVEASAPLATSYMREVDANKANLEETNYEIQQSIRAGRRRFMDAGPQDGVSSFLGLQTKDDKILLFFWISYIIGITAITVGLLLFYGRGMTFQQKMGFGISFIIVSAIIAYLAIIRLA